MILKVALKWLKIDYATAQATGIYELCTILYVKTRMGLQPLEVKKKIHHKVTKSDLPSHYLKEITQNWPNACP